MKDATITIEDVVFCPDNWGDKWDVTFKLVLDEDTYEGEYLYETGEYGEASMNVTLDDVEQYAPYDTPEESKTYLERTIDEDTLRDAVHMATVERIYVRMYEVRAEETKKIKSTTFTIEGEN